MAASHPTSIKSFTTKTDKVDLVAAAHINDIQLEIVQMQEGPQIGTAFPGAPADGWLFYRTDLNVLYIYNGAGWDPVSLGVATAVQGDIIYASAAATWANLAKGTSGKFLQIGATIPAWADLPHGIEVYTSNDNFTAPAGVTMVYLTMVGGGGGGAGADAVNGGAGGGGGQCIVNYPYVVTPEAVYAIVIGAAGTGGAAGANNGTNGAVTRFDTGGDDLTMARGGLGIHDGAGGTGGGGNRDGGDGGATAGYAGMKGGDGGDVAVGAGGGGGASAIGVGGITAGGAGETGKAPVNGYGGGGSGGSNGVVVGGAGTPGICIVIY